MLRIQNERIKRGWSQAELARRARMLGSDVCRIEHGFARPYPGQRRRLAQALEVEAERLDDEVDGGLLDTADASRSFDIEPARLRGLARSGALPVEVVFRVGRRLYFVAEGLATALQVLGREADSGEAQR